MKNIKKQTALNKKEGNHFYKMLIKIIAKGLKIAEFKSSLSFDACVMNQCRQIKNNSDEVAHMIFGIDKIQKQDLSLKRQNRRILILAVTEFTQSVSLDNTAELYRIFFHESTQFFLISIT